MFFARALSSAKFLHSLAETFFSKICNSDYVNGQNNCAQLLYETTECQYLQKLLTTIHYSPALEFLRNFSDCLFRRSFRKFFRSQVCSFCPRWIGAFPTNTDLHGVIKSPKHFPHKCSSLVTFSWFCLVRCTCVLQGVLSIDRIMSPSRRTSPLEIRKKIMKTIQVINADFETSTIACANSFIWVT